MVRAVAWLREEQAPWACAVGSALGIEWVGAGAPSAARSPAVAEALGAAPVADLRGALIEAQADLIWLLDPGAFGSDPSDARALSAAAARGVRVATSAPIPASGFDLGPIWSTPASPGGVARVPLEIPVLVPALRDSASWHAAEDLREAAGEVRSLTYVANTPAPCMALCSLLADGLDVAMVALGEFDTVSAAMDPGPAPSTLRDLQGRLHVLMRSADGRPASLVLTDREGFWSRRVLLDGQAGQIELSDAELVWRDGVSDDRSAWPLRDADGRPGTGVLAAALRRLIELPAGAGRAAPTTRVLSAAEAVLLSLRTRQPERPVAFEHR